MTKRLVLCSLLFVVLGASPGAPSVDAGSIGPYSQDQSEFGPDRISIAEHKDFRCVVLLLERLVDHRNKTGRQSFYISPVGTQGHGTFVRVYWPEDNSILLVHLPVRCVDGQSVADDSDLWWYDRKARIDLETGVVPTQEDIGTSTYLVSQPWVDTVIEDCRTNGYPVVVYRSDPPN